MKDTTREAIQDFKEGFRENFNEAKKFITKRNVAILIAASVVLAGIEKINEGHEELKKEYAAEKEAQNKASLAAFRKTLEDLNGKTLSDKTNLVMADYAKLMCRIPTEHGSEFSFPENGDRQNVSQLLESSLCFVVPKRVDTKVLNLNAAEIFPR